MRIISQPTEFLPGIEPGIKRADVPNFIMSNTFRRRLGDNLPRREPLIGMATTLACTTLPIRPVRAVPLILVGVGALALAAAAYKRFAPTRGIWEASNDDDDQKKGFVVYTVYNDNEDVEQSVSLRYSFPPNTTIIVRFDAGPAATTRGDKVLQVAAAEDKDEADFTAT